MRDTFIVYTEHIEDVEELTNEEAGMLLKALLAYNAGEALPDDLPSVVRILFKNMRREMDYNHNRYEEQKQKRSESGKKGMRNRWCTENKTEEDISLDNKNNNVINEDNKNNNVINEDNKNNLSVTVTDTVTDTVSAKADSIGNAKALPTRERTRKTIPPTVEEVTEYCRERSNGVDAEHFCNYYEARGWELSKGRKMKDWQAAVRTWEHNGFGRDAPSRSSTNPYLELLREEGLYDAGGNDKDIGYFAPSLSAIADS